MKKILFVVFALALGAAGAALVQCRDRSGELQMEYEALVARHEKLCDLHCDLISRHRELVNKYVSLLNRMQDFEKQVKE